MRKYIALLLGAALLSTTAYTIAPLQLKTSLESFVFGFISVPYNQAVSPKGYEVKIETGSLNRLVNGSFDSQIVAKGWDEATLGAWQIESSACLEGSCLSIDTTDSAQAGELRQTINWNSGQEDLSIGGSVYIYRDVLDEGEYEVCLDTICQGITRFGWAHYVFPSTSSSSNVFYIRPTGGDFTNGKRAKLSVDIASLGLKDNTAKLGTITNWKTHPSPDSLWNGAINNGTIEASYRRVGDSLEMTFGFITGNTTAWPGSLIVNLPFGLEIDTEKLKHTGNIQAIGTAYALDNGSAHYIGTAATLSSTEIAFYSHVGGSNWSGSQPFGWNVSTNDRFSTKFTVPIKGWGALEEFIVQDQELTVFSENRFTAFVTEGGVISRENHDWIDGNCADVSTVSTCTFNDLGLTVPMNCTFTESSGTSTPTAVRVAVNNTTTEVVLETARSGILECTKTEGDYNKALAVHGKIKNATYTEEVQNPKLCSGRINGASGFGLVNHFGGCADSVSGFKVTFKINFWKTTPNCVCTVVGSYSNVRNCQVNSFFTYDNTEVTFQTANETSNQNLDFTFWCHGEGF